MKGLKRTLLALGIAGFPAAAMADIVMLDDSAMGNITGQAGVTIELETKINMDRFIYTDEGSLTVSDISIGGAERTDFFGFNGLGGPDANDLLDNIRIDIDVLADGDAAINIQPQYFNAVDFRITSGAWELWGQNGQNTALMDNLFIEGVMGRGSIHVDTDTDVMRLRSAFAIEVMDFDVPFAAIGVRGLSLTGADYDKTFPSVLDLFAEVDLYIYHGMAADGMSALAIDMPSFAADIGMQEVIVGQASIGQIFIDDLAITNTQMRIYGH
ncbi:MAG: DUF6160 family protein [Marinobacter sp.]|nr:DUF6160 family protein [Marinobacter sp.]